MGRFHLPASGQTVSFDTVSFAGFFVYFRTRWDVLKRLDGARSGVLLQQHAGNRCAQLLYRFAKKGKPVEIRLA